MFSTALSLDDTASRLRQEVDERVQSTRQQLDAEYEGLHNQLQNNFQRSDFVWAREPNFEQAIQINDRPSSHHVRWQPQPPRHDCLENFEVGEHLAVNEGTIVSLGCCCCCCACCCDLASKAIKVLKNGLYVLTYAAGAPSCFMAAIQAASQWARGAGLSEKDVFISSYVFSILNTALLPMTAYNCWKAFRRTKDQSLLFRAAAAISLTSFLVARVAHTILWITDPATKIFSEAQIASSLGKILFFQKDQLTPIRDAAFAAGFALSAVSPLQFCREDVECGGETIALLALRCVRDLLESALVVALMTGYTYTLGMLSLVMAGVGLSCDIWYRARFRGNDT
jgi:hypothetical protein